MRTARKFLSTLLFLLVATSCRRVEPLPASALHDLRSLDAFRAEFNAEANRARLIVVISPT
jgi:hypothetical protein